MEDLWARAEPYLDDDAAEKATVDFHAVFWECFLASTLLGCGLSLVPRADRHPRVGGPDFLVKEPRVWVEAVAVQPGTGPDALEWPEPGVVQSVQDDGVILRLAQALEAKRQTGLRYRRRGWLLADDPYVIAVNSGAVPDGKMERNPPRVIRTVFPFGDEAIYIDPSTMQATQRVHARRTRITKMSGGEVSTRAFEQPEFDGVSGILYSIVDAFNPPAENVDGLCLVRNPRATQPLSSNFRPDILTYWRDGDLLRWRFPGDPWLDSG